ncbi:MAG: hypothetical protein I8H71_01150 [Xanthomonadaceae bacterium]|nr:hypothetical protein [Xanthomonadaceae bacterium]
MSRKDLPAPTTPNWGQRVNEELRVLMGKGGPANGRAVTVGDLAGGGTGVPGGGGGGGGGSTPYEPDLTPPPTPTGFTLDAAISNVFIEHDAPLYSQGHGHSRTQVFGAKAVTGQPLPTFSDAVLLTEFTGIVFAYPTDPATHWRMWIKWVTVDGVPSTIPAGGVSGLGVVTGQDVQLLLEALTGQITESQLYSTLGARIGLIDGSGPGSVNARIATVQSNVDAVNAQLAEVIGAADYNSATAYAAGELVKYDGKLYRAKVGTVGNLPTNTTYWELVGEFASVGEAVAAHAVQLSDHSTRIGANETGLTAEVTARNTLAAQLRGSYTGTDPNALTQGLAFNERQARVAADTANAQLTQGVRTDLTAAQGTLNTHGTAITTLTTRSDNIDGQLSSQAGRLDVVEAGVTSGGADGLVIDPDLTNGQASWADTITGLTVFNSSDAGVPANAPAAKLVRSDPSASRRHSRKLRGGIVDGSVAIVTPGEVIDASVWVYLEGPVNGTGSTGLRVLHGNTTNPNTSSAASSTYLATAGVWTLLRVSFTIPSGSTRIRVSVVRTSAAETGYAWFAGLQAQRRGAAAANVNAAVVAASEALANQIGAEATARQTLAANISSPSGDNLIQNPGFDPAGYRLEQTSTISTTGYALATDAGVPANAPNVVVMVREKLTAVATRSTVIMRLANGLTRYPVREGEVIDLSGWMAMTGGLAGTARVFLVVRDDTTAALGPTNFALILNATSGWQKLSAAPYVMPAGAATIEVGVALEASAPAGMKMFVGDIDMRKRSGSTMALAVAVQTEASARAGVDGYMGAQQNVRIDVAGHVSGYGASGSSPDGSGASATSNFGVRANTFFVAPPSLAQAAAPTANLYDGFVWLDTSVSPAVTRYRSGVGWTTVSPALPFTILTTPTTINGVAVPAGVYMKDAFFQNGTITNAKIGNLAVDDAKIANLSVSKLLAGSMVVGQWISSASYVPGTQGWHINAAGNAEFNNVTVRGTVYATAGSIGGITIASGALQSANYTWNGTGFHFAADGNVYINALRARGAVMGGAYSAYAWPASGTGFYLGAEGLLLGNPNTGRHFEVQANGNVRSQNFSIVDGNVWFSGSGTFNGNGTFSGNLAAAGGTFSGVLAATAVDAVNTLNVAGGAITAMRFAAWPAVFWWRKGAALASIGFNNIPSGSSGIALRGLATVRLTAAEFAGTLTIYIIRNNDGAEIGSGIAILDNLGGGATSVSLPVAVEAFDPSPIVGYSEYSIRVGQKTPASSDTGGQLYAASISGTGGKR